MICPPLPTEAWESYKREIDWFSAPTGEYQVLARLLIASVIDSSQLDYKSEVENDTSPFAHGCLGIIQAGV